MHPLRSQSLLFESKRPTLIAVLDPSTHDLRMIEQANACTYVDTLDSIASRQPSAVLCLP